MLAINVTTPEGSKTIPIDQISGYEPHEEFCVIVLKDKTKIMSRNKLAESRQDLPSIHKLLAHPFTLH